MARLMLSAGMFSDFAARIAVRRRGFMSGSPPDLAAIAISLMRRGKIFPRLASSAPFLCLIVAHFEWPDIALPHLWRTKISLILRTDFRTTDSARGGNHRISLDVQTYRRTEIIARVIA